MRTVSAPVPRSTATTSPNEAGVPSTTAAVPARAETPRTLRPAPPTTTRGSPPPAGTA
ncbi:hypothetical protein [Plantactinospora sp. BC1]|uniref:hypothetical protein n=1 Tax=Plantactinospora sp. BC1 TaxID=2108470 RepID=UPI001F35901B|nr:hypothetical protein [Plantactinospora sp. BC1]